jgi:hypothetical protein
MTFGSGYPALLRAADDGDLVGEWMRAAAAYRRTEFLQEYSRFNLEHGFYQHFECWS